VAVLVIQITDHWTVTMHVCYCVYVF